MELTFWILISVLIIFIIYYLSIKLINVNKNNDGRYVNTDEMFDAFRRRRETAERITVYMDKRRQAVRDINHLKHQRRTNNTIEIHHRGQIIKSPGPPYYGSIPEFIKPCGEVILDKDCQPVLVEEFITEEEMEI